jgi:hypothetical protein
MTRDCAMKYHGQRGKTTMVEGQNTIGSGFNKRWIGDRYAMAWGGQNTMSREFKISWIGGSNCHG